MISKYFTEKELACKHCGEFEFDQDFLDLLDEIREECDFPFPVTSGYRCALHPIEARKSSPGAHQSGKAIDILASGEKAMRIVEVALSKGIKRIGVNQKGQGRFIHLDVSEDHPAPAFWSY